MSTEHLGTTKNGFDVYLDRESSHALTHIAKNPKLLEYVKIIIPTLEPIEDVVRFDRDIGEIVGTTDLVETNEEDEIVYALRPLRTQYSRFVKNKTAQPTTWITIDLRRLGEKEYALYTTFIGRLTPSFPGGNFLPEQSREFWSKHALVWGAQEIVPGTETTECPW
jgi:hypothetical protein